MYDGPMYLQTSTSHPIIFRMASIDVLGMRNVALLLNVIKDHLHGMEVFIDCHM